MEEQKRFKTYKIIMLVVLVAFITFLVTSIVMYQYFTNDSFGKSIVEKSEQTSDIAETLEDYRKIIDKYYLGDIDEEKLKEGAIAGYIKGLDDEYTEYISKEDMADYMADATGNFVGVGVYMVQDTEANKIMVLSPIKGSPAEKAGLQPGDYIIAVDGVTYTGEQMTEASNKIKGETGTTVKLQIQRKDETLDIELTRENIKVNPVEGEVLENNIGYIEFSSFDDGTAEEFKIKFEELQGKGIKSLIIDLRNNGGGIVDEALEIANYILDKDSVILYEVDKNNNETVEKTTDDPIINMPIVILTNENTASSSEILAGALKDHKKATIVGEKTYGKGVIQEFLSLSNGGGLKITIEEYYTPNRTKINGVGITPDVEIELETSVTGLPTDTNDTQLNKAKEILHQQ